MSGSSFVFDLAERRLDWLDRRQTVLAQNIANANTPGYHAKDLNGFSAALAASARAAAAVLTNPLHLAGTLGEPSATHAIEAEASPDGNNVALDSELGMVADTDTSQELVTDIYKKYATLFRTALGH